MNSLKLSFFVHVYFVFLSFVRGCFVVVVVFPIQSRSLSIVCWMTKGEEEKKCYKLSVHELSEDYFISVPL